MANVPMPDSFDLPDDNDTPLPMIVAKRWDFPLAYVETEDGIYYAVQDWIRGLTGEEDVRKIWNKLKKQPMWNDLSTSSRQMPYKMPDGRTFKLNYALDKGLYLITQYLRVTKDRPVLDQIRKFLASAGAFVDELRLDPDQAIQAFIDAHRADGKDDNWIWMRLYGKMRRQLFITALTEAVVESLNPRQYAEATNDIYLGLWGRTSAHLKRELDVKKHESLRDRQPMMGLYYQGIAEEAAAIKLGDRQEVTFADARAIIQAVANFVGKQAAEMAEFMQMDLATGRPLMSDDLKKHHRKKSRTKKSGNASEGS